MNITCSSIGYIKSYIFNATFSMSIKRLYAKTGLCIFVLYGNRVQVRDVASGNVPIQVQQPLATSIWMEFAENAVKLTILQAPQLVEPIGFLHLRRFPVGYHIRSAGECYPLQWVHYMLLFNFSVTTQKMWHLNISLCDLLQLILESQEEEECLPDAFNKNWWYLEPSLIFVLTSFKLN